MKKYILFPTLFCLFIFFFFSKQTTLSAYAQCVPTGTSLGCDPSACAFNGGQCITGFALPACFASIGDCTTDGTAQNPTVQTGLCVKPAACTPTNTPIPNAPTSTPEIIPTVTPVPGGPTVTVGGTNLTLTPAAACITTANEATAVSGMITAVGTPISANLNLLVGGNQYSLGWGPNFIENQSHPVDFTAPLSALGGTLPNGGYTVVATDLAGGQFFTLNTTFTQNCAAPTPTNTPIPSPTALPSPTATPTPGPACGSTCATNSDCGGATGGCSVCDPGTNTCQTPPACGTACSSDSTCAGAGSGCNSCLSGVCSTPNTTKLAFTVFLDDIGQYGDNANPTDTSLSNQSPLHPTRTLNVTIYDSNNNLVSSPSGTITYNSSTGNFTGIIDLGNLPTGDYVIRAKTDGYLERTFAAIQNIQTDSTNIVPSNNMIAGDINDDNQLDILDYNVLLDCGYGAIDPLPMSDPTSVYNSPTCQSHQFRANADLNDDGIIDSKDYNLFVRELSVQAGD